MLVVKNGQLWEEINWNNGDIMGSVTTIWYLISDLYEHKHGKQVDAISLNCNSKIGVIPIRMLNMANWKLICE
jgi:hypothetical protein